MRPREPDIIEAQCQERSSRLMNVTSGDFVFQARQEWHDDVPDEYLSQHQTRSHRPYELDLTEELGQFTLFWLNRMHHESSKEGSVKEVTHRPPVLGVFATQLKPDFGRVIDDPCAWFTPHTMSHSTGDDNQIDLFIREQEFDDFQNWGRGKRIKTGIGSIEAIKP